jgi:hypothetical protein
MWAEATRTRLKSWGFTTIGGWSDYQDLRQCSATSSDLALTPVLHIGSTAGAPWWDMWDSKITDRMDQIARGQILAIRDEPRLLGYYSDNEMGWWNDSLFKMTLEQAPTSGQRRKLLAFLRETYRNDWSNLLTDFEPRGAEDWRSLDERGLLFPRPGSGGVRVMRQFLGLMAERYYSLVHDIIRKYDRRALILGDRYQSFFYPEVARAARPFVDAISSNLNAPWNDGTFPHFYLETLHSLSGKPLFISEFYMSARQNRSGNQNNRGVFPVVDTQKQRVVGFQRTVHELLRLPYVIGVDWFQYHDEPTHGRYDGENFNFGFIDIHNRPYQRLVQAASELDLIALKAKPVPTRVNAALGVPPAPKDPLGQFLPTLALKHWDRERGFVKPISELPMADLYICWNRRAVYLGLYAQDVVEDEMYRDKIVPEVDRGEWIVGLAGSTNEIRAHIGGGLKPRISNPKVRIVNLSGVNANVRNIAAIELPARLLGRTVFRKGDQVEFVSSFVSHCKIYRTEWRGTLTLAR